VALAANKNHRPENFRKKKGYIRTPYIALHIKAVVSCLTGGWSARIGRYFKTRVDTRAYIYIALTGLLIVIVRKQIKRITTIIYPGIKFDKVPTNKKTKI
jgi:small basic protein